MKVHIVQYFHDQVSEILSVHENEAKAQEIVRKRAEQEELSKIVVNDLSNKKFMGYCDKEERIAIVYHTLELD